MTRIAIPSPVGADRAKSYAKTALIIYALTIIGFFTGTFGKPLDSDFVTFWAASRLTLDGRAAEVFDLPQLVLVEHSAVPASSKAYAWHYPPTYQLLIEPLALLPYLPACLAFTGLSLLFYLFALRRIVPEPGGIPLILAFPGAFVCLLHGQNSLFSAGLFACALVAMQRRPLLAGLCFGLLSLKPQLAVLVPLALATAGQWRALLAAAATAVALAAAATAAFGFAQWMAFFQDWVTLRAILEGGLVPWEKMPTAFVFFRWMGLPAAAAYGAQIATAFLSAAVVFGVFRRQGASLPAGAVLVSASLLVSPFLFDYEMAILAVPLAILAADKTANGGLTRREWLAMAILYLAPLFTTGLAKLTHLQVGFPVLLGMLGLSCWRLYRYPPTARMAHPD